MVDTQYMLNSLHLHDFKLFDDVVIYFSGVRLFVLDGPNGYGKTSVFDAIEYALTGQIKRVVNELNIDKRLAYEENFLFRCSNGKIFTDTYVEITLTSPEQNSLTIKREVCLGEGKENNPKNLKGNTTTYITFDDGTGKKTKKYAKVDQANKILSEWLGDSVQSYFDEYYYISQEDRLIFLKRTESDRMQCLQRLFLMDEETAEKEALSKAQKSVKQLLDKLTNIHNRVNEELGKMRVTGQQQAENLTPYTRLLPKTKRVCDWDNEEPVFSDEESLKNLKTRVLSMKMFLQNYPDYCRYVKNDWIDKIVQNGEILMQYAFLLNFYENDKLDAFWVQAERYKKITHLVQTASLQTPQRQIDKLDFNKLAAVLEISFSTERVESYQEQIRACKNRMTAVQKAKSELQKLRNQLIDGCNVAKENNSYPFEDGKCPLCGHNWFSEKLLQQSVDQVKEALNAGNAADKVLIDEAIERLTEIYEMHFSEKLSEFFNKASYLQDAHCNNMVERRSEIEASFFSIDKKLREYDLQSEIQKLPLDALKEWDERFEILTGVLRAKQEPLSNSNYFDMHKDHQFEMMYMEYFDNHEAVIHCRNELPENGFNNKLTYLEQQYAIRQMKLFTTLQEKAEMLDKQFKRCKKLYEKLKDLIFVFDQTLRDYKKAVVMQIRIPFYFYSGRILQNYRGGLGILIHMPKEESIRFSAYDRREHDALYTLSSGQLTAIVLALTLTLNRLYAQGQLRCILIDDPAQTMDELNTSSLVELMRTDFSDCQFVIATHEEDFSDYIRYKFEKYQLKTKHISMKDKQYFCATNSNEI